MIKKILNKSLVGLVFKIILFKKIKIQKYICAVDIELFN